MVNDDLIDTVNFFRPVPKLFIGGVSKLPSYENQYTRMISDGEEHPSNLQNRFQTFEKFCPL